ncbi:MAG: transcription elongation factor GreB [Gammaproteobacteria bacterium]|nr:MAG: transcription elongation factor GreB [Gammaproteobacteria bacterium]
MGRWKPPPPASSPYITRPGYEQLQQELKEIWLRRRDVVKALAAAAAEGDRSENAEYIYRKKELGGIDYRIRYLQKRLPNLKVVDQNQNQDKVFFGAWVLLERDDDSQVEYRIVGPDETDGESNSISMDSPLAKALLRKAINDEVQMTVAGNSETYLITGIRYQ